MIARWLYSDANVLLFDEPTRGVDVATKLAIYDLLFEFRSLRKSVVITSSEVEELMTVCDRILVLSDRQLVRIFSRDDWSKQDIVAAAFSAFASTNTSAGNQDACLS